MNKISSHSFSIDAVMLRKTILLLYILILIYQLWQNQLTFQLQEAPLRQIGADNFLWLVFALQIPQFLCTGSIAYFFDLALFTTAILSFIFIDKKSLACIFSCLFLVYFANIQAISVHHEHSLIGCIFCLPLLFLYNHKRSTLFLELLRIYLVYIFVSAAVWKILRGSAFDQQHMQHVLIDQHSPYFESYSSAVQSYISFFVTQPIISFLLWITVIIGQLSCFIMLFTKRFDRYYCIGFVLYFILDYFIMNINFFPFIIFGIVFIPSWQALHTFYKSDQVIS